MKKINELWIVVFGLLSLILYIEWSHVKHHEKADTLPSDKQPPGVDEADDFPRSLEEALLGE